MNRCLFAVVVAFFSLSVNAECQLIASQTNVNYQRLSAAERQRSKEIELPEKNITFSINCDTPQRIRLFFGSSLSAGGTFGFGEQGSMTIIAENAMMDNNNVRLTTVRKGDANVLAAGVMQAKAELNQGIAFVNGQELTGKVASVTLKVIPKLKSGSITEQATYRGNLQVKVEAQ